VTYLRGKSNVIEVFDTQTENVLIQKSYKESMGIIKGLITLSTDVFNVKNILIDEKGKMVVSSMPKGAPSKKS